MKLKLGLVSMTVKYAYQRGNTIYFQRAIPDDLQARYGSKRVKIRLDAKDLSQAAHQIERLNCSIEAEWKAMRDSSKVPPKSVRQKALELLTEYGLSPAPAAPDPHARDILYDFLDGKRESYAGGDDRAYRTAPASAYLAPEEAVAAQMLAGTLKPTLSDVLEAYLEFHPKRSSEKLVKDARRNFETLIALRGDKPIDTLTREDGHAIVAHLSAKGLSTGSVRRMNNTYRAALAFYCKEKDVDMKNPFDALPIPDEGKDKKHRVPYSHEELHTLSMACVEWDDSKRWIVAMLVDTGARLAEIVGLPLNRIKLDVPIPFIEIMGHGSRTLKNEGSERDVPLVGMALWAARRIVATAKKGQTFAFPEYSGTAATNANLASATLNKWIKARKLDHNCHELRHTMADRLRDVQCPKDIRFAIGGWSTQEEGEDYGSGYGLRVKHEWLTRIVTVVDVTSST